MLTIVIPMAGRGSRFADSGYPVPKPLIPIHGMPMIEVVVRNLSPSEPARFVFLCQAEHLRTFDFESRLRDVAPGCDIRPVDGITEGAACTVLLAAEVIDHDDVLVIANSDQWVDRTMDVHLATLRREHLDGLIMTMTATDPKWSFVRLNDRRRVTEVVEKVPISDEATVGIYTFARGRDFIRAAEAMIAADERVNGEFYVAPVYNQLVAEGAQIGVDNVGAEGDGMYGLGIPADYEHFVSLPIARRAASSARTPA
jgi:dTDP-glucose pyrophosphorylase